MPSEGHFQGKGTGAGGSSRLTSGGGAKAKWQDICLLGCCAVWLLANLQHLRVGVGGVGGGDIGHGLFSFCN